jgi:hypothetical protein
VQTEVEALRLKGEGDVEYIVRTKVRKRCEICDGLAKYKHTFLLEGMRNNPASSAYCKDDCSWCQDAEVFTCGPCKPDVPDGYVGGSRFECGDRFAHLFLEWEEMDAPYNWECGCGHINGINLATCAQCDRKPGASQ